VREGGSGRWSQRERKRASARERERWIDRGREMDLEALIGESSVELA
jgi:hypothetical protein